MITYGFFNSVDGDRKYNAETITTYFEGLVSDGVYENVDQKLMVKASNIGRKVIVEPGRALVKLHWVKNDSDLLLDIDENLTSNQRYDAVVIRWNKNTRDVTISIKKGVPDNYTPINTTIIKELVLAIVAVYPNVDKILQMYINDTRGTAKCPWVTGLIEQVDTSQLFSQYKNAFDEYYGEMTTQFTKWFNSLTKELSVPCKLTESKQHKDITNITDSVIVPAERFKPGDILTVIVDNLVLCEGTDYTLNSVETGTRINFAPALVPGKKLDTVVLKSVIDESAEVRILENTAEMVDEKTADLRSKQIKLYDSSIGAIEVALSDSPSNYDYFNVFVTFNNKTGMIAVPYPLITNISQGTSLSTYPGAMDYQKNSIINTMFMFNDSAKTIHIYASAMSTISESGATTGTTATNVLIKKVVGYKI